MKRIFFLLALFLWLGVSSANADFDMSKWAFSKEIRLVSTGAKLVAFTLDNEVFENAKEGLSDLRIIDNNGKEIAYKLTVETSKQSSELFNVSISNLGSVPGQFTQLVLDLNKAGILHNSVTLSTSSRDFRRQVEVEASNDGTNWLLVKKASDGVYIYDYSLDFKAQNTTVSYPESTYRFLRLKIMDNGEEPVKITGATVKYNVLKTAKEIGYKPKVLEKAEDKEKRANVYVLDFGAKGIPSGQVTFKSPDGNFNREVLVEGSNDNNSWSQVGRDVIFNYQTPKFNGEKKTINYSETNFRYLRLTFYNRDNQPVSISDFAASGTLRKVLFQMEPSVKYNLYYGNSDARFPEYDLESYVAYLDTNNVTDAVLGSQVKNGSFVGKIPAKKPLSERNPYLLPGVLGVMVLVLGGMVLRLASQVKRRR